MLRPPMFALAALLFVTPTITHALAIRHDRPERDYLALADAFPNVGCVSGVATATLIHSRWVLTGAHVGEIGSGWELAGVGFSPRRPPAAPRTSPIQGHVVSGPALARR